MKCSTCGKEDLDHFEEVYVNNIHYIICIEEGDQGCYFRVQQAMLRAIHLLREQHGLTLFDNGVPMNPEINGVEGPQLVWREVPPDSLWDSFIFIFCEFVDNFLYFITNALVNKAKSCVLFTRNLSHKILWFLPNSLRRKS